MAKLEITSPDGKTRSMALEGARLSLGRASDNDLPFPADEGLSRHHFVLERCGEDWAVEDLKSKNGTFVNAERLSARRVLKVGDRITASCVTLIFGDRLGLDQTVLFETPTAPSGGITASTNLAGLLARETAEVVPSWSATAATALLRVGRELGVRRPLAELFQVILDLALESVNASRGVLLTSEKCGLIVQSSRGEGFRISTTVRDRVLEGRTSLLVLDTSQDEQLRSQASIVVQSVHSFMAVPLQTDDRVVGLIYVDTPRAGRQFTTGDLELLTVMANVAAIRIERERLAEVEVAERRHADELEQAADIQRRFLPACPPAIPGLDLAGYNAPCRMVGGDYFDFLPAPAGRVGVVIGDVAGKGMPAALMMMNLQARVQALADCAPDPSSMVMRLNRGIAATCPGNRFITFFLASVDPAAGQLRFANAGHNPPFLFRSNGEVVALTDGGPVLGIFEAIAYGEFRCGFAPGDLLLLYSDGVTEALNAAQEEFGEERLKNLVAGLPSGAPAAAIVSAIQAAVGNWAGGLPASDDITVVAVRRTA